MKNQQVVVDYMYMLKTSFIYIALAFCGWLFIKLIQIIFLLPTFLKNNQEKILKVMEKHTKLNGNEMDEEINNKSVDMKNIDIEEEKENDAATVSLPLEDKKIN